MSDHKMLTARPEKLFLNHQVIEHNGVLTAAIVGDLFYWLAKGAKPWRLARDYAELFNVNEKTIRLHFDKLVDELNYISRARTRMGDGKLGAYQFKANSKADSKALLSIYKSILNNSNIKGDFGEFDPNCPDYKEIPTTQLLLMSTVAETRCIKSAYLLDRINWALVARYQDELCFRDKGHLSNWLGLPYKTAGRLLDRLTNLGMVSYEIKNDQLIVASYTNSSRDFFESYMSDKHESRSTAVAEKFSC